MTETLAYAYTHIPMGTMACQNAINSTSQNIMPLSKYRSTWLNISYNFQNLVQLLEMYHVTQEGCIIFWEHV